MTLPYAALEKCTQQTNSQPITPNQSPQSLERKQHLCSITKSTRFSEDLPGTECRRQQHVEAPLLAPERLVDAGRHVPGRRAQTHVQDQATRHQGAAVSRRQETQAREHCGQIGQGQN